MIGTSELSRDVMTGLRTGCALLLISALASFHQCTALAQQPAEGPKILLSHVLAVKAGETVKIKLRGKKLDGVSEVKSAAAGVMVKILNKGAAEVPQKLDAEKVGNTQVEIELVLPVDLPAGKLALVAKSDAGESPPFELFIGGPHPVVAEKEGNDGFRAAQEIALPACVDGAIQSGQDVDVFAVELGAGETLTADLLAARHSSALDGLLSLYDARGTLVKQSDDQGDSRDPRLEFKASAAGKYFVVVQDAFDYGGPTHPYRLVLTK